MSALKADVYEGLTIDHVTGSGGMVARAVAAKSAVETTAAYLAEPEVWQNVLDELGTEWVLGGVINAENALDVVQQVCVALAKVIQR